MDFLISIIILAVTVILGLPMFKNYRKTKALAKYVDIFPGEKWYLFIGTSLNVLRITRETFWDNMKIQHSTYGPIFRSWLAWIPTIHIYKPEHIQIIMKSNTNISKGVFLKFLQPWLGEGLFSATNPTKWKHNRKLITPAFHFKILDSYTDIFSEKGEYFAKYLDKYHGKGYFEVTEHLTRLTADVISETAMGVELNFMKNGESKYAESINNILRIFFARLFSPLLHNDFIFSFTSLGKEHQAYLDYIRKFNRQVITQRKEYFEKNKNRAEEEDEFGRKKKMSFLDILLTQQENNNFGIDQIEAEVNTFMFAGQDTTASTLCWTFLALGNNPEIQIKVQEELDSIFEDDPERKITAEDLTKMEYLERVIKEVLRCYNFTPHLSRVLLEDIELDGHTIPKGCNILMSIYDTHHDPEHWPDPYKFDPDRFLPENIAKRHPYAFVPFSAGPRNCIGQKFGMQDSKVLLAHIFRRHNIKCRDKPEDIKYFLEVVLKPQNGFHISVEPRRKL